MLRVVASVCALALALNCTGAQAQPSVAAAASSGISDEAKLRPIAPELRDAARRALDVTKRYGLITAQKVIELHKTGGGFPPPAPRLADIPVTEQMISGPTGAPQVKLFVINAKPGTARPGILHVHGGGYIIGTAQTDVPRLQAMARDLGCVIVSVEYRLAPETDYRGSTEDTYAGLRWMYRNADGLGLDRRRLAVMGESAGGGHAALLAIMARDRGEVPIALQVLVYPMLDDKTGITPPPPGIATVGWSASENQVGWRAFLGQQPGTGSVPARAVPARTRNLAGLPPTFIEVGSVDLFASEDLAYARRLIEAGVPTEVLVVPGAFHGFEPLAGDTPLVREFVGAKMAALRRAFGLPTP